MLFVAVYQNAFPKKLGKAFLVDMPSKYSDLNVSLVNFIEDILPADYDGDTPLADYDEDIPLADYDMDISTTDYDQNIPPSDYDWDNPSSDSGRYVPPVDYEQNMIYSNR